MSDTQTRYETNGQARSNNAFSQPSEATLFFVQAVVLTAHSISNTSDRERERDRDEGSKNKGRNQHSNATE
jgi:hypothetical protein